MQSVMKVDIVKSSIIVALAILFGMPFFTVFGALSDKIGRLKVMRRRRTRSPASGTRSSSR